MKKLLIFLCLVTCFATNIAQSNNRITPDGFHGLVLNQATAQDAIGLLGQPVADKLGRLEVSKLGRWLEPKHKEKIFRHLTFKKIADFRIIELSFLDDKLMMIELEFSKTIQPEKLENVFGVVFTPLGGPVDLPDKPEQQPRAFFATHYPDFFLAFGVSDQAFLLANCNASQGVPSNVEKTRQISRALAKK